ncbi:hypothetical protein [Janthinobacterium sp. HLX7-2]|uniref:hypothetical protein n=1 Tax=Janthinobacterium sp. HLX7-2 TaxID=1259331 RepID=UPI003F25132D
MSIFVGKHALIDAFSELVVLVDGCMTAGVQLSEIRNVPIFSYILTGKQADALREICVAQGWPIPSNRGIEIDVRYIAHVLQSRDTKDQVDTSFVTEILTAAYCEYGIVEINKTRNQQAIVINATKKIPLNGAKYYGMAIIEVQQEPTGNVKLAPKTAYHATEAKLRGIQNKKNN